MRNVLLIILLTTLSILKISAQCMLVPISLEERVDSANIVVEAKVLYSKCLWNESHTLIYTQYALEISKVFKGDVNADTVFAVERGGIVGLKKHANTLQLELANNNAGIFCLYNSTADLNISQPFYDFYTGPQGFIKYNSTTTANDAFNDYNDLENDLYNSIQNRTNTIPQIKKALDWQGVNFTTVEHNDANSLQSSSSNSSNNSLQTTSSNNLSVGNTSGAVSSTGTITALSLSTTQGGVGNLLTITGTGFGTTQSTSYVQFRNVDNYGTSTSYISPVAGQYVSWSNTQIQVYVPQDAGTGVVRVSDGTNTITSTATITVQYGIINVDYMPSTTLNAYRPKSQNDNSLGGYTFRASTNLSSQQKLYFDTTMYAWRCYADMNWYRSTDTSLTTLADDGINLVVKENTNATQPAGAIAVANSYYNGCISGSDVLWNLDEIDVTVDNALSFYYGTTGTPSATQYDYYTAVLHELGHALGLSHTSVTSNTMYYSMGTADPKRTPSTNEQNGAIAQVTHSQGTVHCNAVLKAYECTPLVTMSVNTAVATEAASTTVTITVTQNGYSEYATVVNLSYSGTATNGTDYSTGPTSITIPAWSLTANATFTITNDAIYEGSTAETVIIDISSVTNGTENGTQQQTISITDNETAPTVTLSVGFPTINEGGVGTTVTATLSSTSAVATTVNLSYSGTTTSTTDYSFPSSVVIPAGSTSVSGNIVPVDDNIYEGSETIIIDISTVTNGTENGTQQQALTLNDNESVPTITLAVSSATVAESVGTYTITATSSVASTQTITITLSTSGTAIGSATDYTLNSSSLVIPAGNTSITTTVAVVNDALYENSETVIIDINTVTNATENGTQQKTTTITDNDIAPTVSILANTSQSEAVGTYNSTLTLSAASGLNTTVTLTTSGTATGSGTDYTISTTFTITSGSTSVSVPITINNDIIYEGNETIILDISTVTNGTENGVQQQTVTITDNETAPTITLSASPTSMSENGGTSIVTLTQSGTSAFTTTISLTYTGLATTTTDYTGSNTTATIAAGTTSTTFTITAVNDAIYEGTETILIDISNVTNGTESGTQQATINITDDETAPTVTLSAFSTIATEGGSGFVIQATLSSASTVATTVNLSTSGVAIFNTDYTFSVSSITIVAGATTGTLSVSAINDNLYEGTQTGVIDISTVTNATENGTQFVNFSVIDNETVPIVTLSTSATSIAESATTYTLTATLSGQCESSVVVTLGTSGTSIGSGTDYTLNSSTITIPGSTSSATTTVLIVDDALDENDETIIVDITGVTVASENGIQQVTTAILDNDAAPTATIAWTNTSIGEAITGTSNAIVTLSAASGLATTFNLSFSNTATLNSDYTVTGSTITIPAGSTTGFITMNNIPDNIYEGNENITAVISTTTNATLGNPSAASMTINDDDPIPTVTLSANSATVIEGGNTYIKATLSNPTINPVTINLNNLGTASSITDYNLGSSITIPALATADSISLNTINNSIYELAETVIVDISNVTNATENGTQTATVTINDNESTPVVSLVTTPASVNENGGTVLVDFTMNPESSLPTTVYLNLGGTATNATDYAVTTPFVINAGSTGASVVVFATDDNVYEGNEIIVVSIDSVTNGVKNGTQTKTITINDNETLPTVTLSVSDTFLNEGGGLLTYTSILSHQSSFPATVVYKFSGTASINDYSKVDTIIIPAYVTGYSVNAFPTEDILDEYDETIIIDIDTVFNAVENGVQQKTINLIDNDIPPTVSFITSSTPLAEPSTNGTFTVTLSDISAKDIMAYWSFDNVATMYGIDYSCPTNVLIPAGTQSVVVNVNIIDDNIFESGEGEIITLDSASNASIAFAQQVNININDNETQPKVSMSLSKDTANENSDNVVITLTQDKVSAFNTTVNVVYSGTVTNTEYFASANAIITAGNTSTIIILSTNDDNIYEGFENIIVDISSISNGAEDGVQKDTIIIKDNENLPYISRIGFANATLLEGQTDSLHININPVSAQATTVYFAIVGDITSADYSANNTITIPAGASDIYLALNAIDDSIDEFDEDFYIAIDSVTNDYNKQGGPSSITFIDNDDEPNLTISWLADTVDENNNATLYFTLDAISNKTITVDLASIGTATNGVDFSTFPTTVTIAAGSLGTSFIATTVNDISNETTESIIAQISNPTNVSIVNTTDTTYIKDMDSAIVSFTKNTTTLTSGDTLDMGMISVGDSVTASFNMNNNGNLDIVYTLSQDASPNSNFCISDNSLTGIVNENDDILFMVKGYMNACAGTQYDSLYIYQVADNTPNPFVLILKSEPAPLNVVASISSNIVYVDSLVTFEVTSPLGASSYSWTNGTSSFVGNTHTITTAQLTDAGIYTVTVADANGCSGTSTLSLTVTENFVSLSIKVFLSGNYNTSNGLMTDGLRSGGYLANSALTEPYSSTPYNTVFTHINGGGGETIDSSLLNITGNNAIVDWVFVQLRDKNNPSTVLATKSALLQRDGDVVSHTDGISPISFTTVVPNDYYVSVRHRNHLGVMTKNAVSLYSTPHTVDFTTTNTALYRRTDANNNNFTLSATRDSCTRLSNGVRTLYSGNTNIITTSSANKIVRYNGLGNDRTSILSITVSALASVTGYYKEDVNLDGTVKYNGVSNDRIGVLQNLGSNSNSFVFEQLPN